MYDQTTSMAIVDWTGEGSGAPTVGTVVTYGPSSIVSASSEGIPAYQGSQFLKSVRTDTSGSSGAHLTSDLTPGSTDVITATFALRLKDADSYLVIYPGTSQGADDMGGFYFTGTGAVKYHNSGWQATILTNNVGQWNTVSLTHTNGIGDWTITVNGQSISLTMTDTGNWSQCVSGVLKSLDFYNANNPVGGSTVYIDAIPEPVPITLLASGLLGLLAYAWKNRG